MEGKGGRRHRLSNTKACDGKGGILWGKGKGRVILIGSTRGSVENDIADAGSGLRTEDLGMEEPAEIIRAEKQEHCGFRKR